MGNGCSSRNSVLVKANGELQRVPAFKIVLIGEPEVGKTSVFLKYTKNQFNYEYKPTRKVNIQNVVKKVNLPGDTVIGVTLWDLPSEEDMDLRDTYYRNTDAAIVVVDMNNMKSIELANSWKQEFANKVTKVKNVTETLPDGSLTSTMEMLPCDGAVIPVLLLGNKYDLVEEKLQKEELKDILSEPLDGENESENTLPKSPKREKPECVKLLEQEAEDHHFVGSVMVSAKDENFSVHSAIQTFVRFLLEDSLPRGKKMLKMSQMTEDEDAETEAVVMSPQQTILPQTGVIELDKIFQSCSVPIKRSQDYATYYDLVLKTFKQTCADMGYLREAKASLEDCIIGLRDALKNDTKLELKVKDDDGFICLYHGMEEDDEFRIDRQLTKTLNIFNQELGGICKAILRDCPIMNATLSTLEAELTVACDKAIETMEEPKVTVQNKAHIVAVCERNRARIRFTQEQNDTSVATVRNALNKVNMALLW